MGGSGGVGKGVLVRLENIFDIMKIIIVRVVKLKTNKI
jgi:hypothetical protein